ncbi:pyridoxamine 5'-phosphate oxidase family protein [Xanthomonas perforans]|nr:MULTISPECIES: pyridoxamine 5'-phosphate oxidase family protein [Xanthomonas]MBO9741007.1 pyridoxamine 5'-phosphate oxidase family protein [Xanthomonas axonopodis pv. begoniae]MBV6781063.1 pyridoxamine 5'-phosphate oxidase family protein [Xanthomonas campestris pv. trichodesmae]MBV6837807.1 pyridoxamine 5'-phosphate oxidase family protein [Xanthomonas campestris pv. merremiae]AEO42639.1 general stress protein [Xanthomonas euvesicatoria pv. citrumelo F1]ATS21557.2 pyridoxamine 5'-phosphate ox
MSGIEMADTKELQEKFWKALKSDRTVMLGLDGVEDGHARPMTAQIEGDSGGPIWFFTSKDNALIAMLGQGRRVIGAFSSKGHDLFASISGSLREDTDPAMVDRLWNPYVAAWYEGGKTDPNLALLRLDADHAQIWLNESSLLAGIKVLLGVDPKKDYQDKVADVPLR